MGLIIRHRKVCAITDNNVGKNAGSVHPSDWNEKLDATQTSAGILGAVEAGDSDVLTGAQLKQLFLAAIGWDDVTTTDTEIKIYKLGSDDVMRQQTIPLEEWT